MEDGTEVPTESRNLMVLVIGRVPEDEPYLWIGERRGATPRHLDTIHARDLPALRSAIDAAIGAPVASR